MSQQDAGNGRVRAWVFVQAEDAEEAARKLYEELGREGGDSWVVVRADVVDYGPYNIMVPVDAENGDELNHVVGLLAGPEGKWETLVVPVMTHNPEIPHDAHGFITPAEHELGQDPEADIGRFPKSPGFNAWG